MPRETSTQDLIHIIITGRGDGTIKESLALRLRKIALRDSLETLRKVRIAEAHMERVKAAESLWRGDIAKYGKFHMMVWSRDCDMCETTNLGAYVSIDEYYHEQEAAGEYAEGPVTWTYISNGDALDFESTTRDRIMENRENGGDGYHLGI